MGSVELFRYKRLPQIAYLVAHAHSGRPCHRDAVLFGMLRLVVSLMSLVLSWSLSLSLSLWLPLWLSLWLSPFGVVVVWLFFGLLPVSVDVSGHPWASLWGPLGSRVGPRGLLARLGMVLGRPWRLNGAPWLACSGRDCLWEAFGRASTAPRDRGGSLRDSGAPFGEPWGALGRSWRNQE